MSLFKEKHLKQITEQLKNDGYSNNDINIIINELKQRTFRIIGVNLLFGFIKVCNN